MNYPWNWGIFGEQVKGGDETYLDWLLTGLGWTLAVSLTAWVIALCIGIAVGALRTTPSRLLVGLGNAWVELFRNIPLLVQMFLWFFVVPEFLPREWSLWVKQDLPAKEFVTAALCLGFFTSAPPAASAARAKPWCASSTTTRCQDSPWNRAASRRNRP